MCKAYRGFFCIARLFLKKKITNFLRVEEMGTDQANPMCGLEGTLYSIVHSPPPQKKNLADMPSVPKLLRINLFSISEM